MPLTALLIVAALAPDFANDLSQITLNVTDVPKPGLPGFVSALNQNVVPFLLGQDGKTVMPVGVATRFGNGAVVVFGHNGYLDEGAVKTESARKLMWNLVSWISHTRSGTAKIGYVPGAMDPKWIEAIGSQPVKIDFNNFEQQLAGVHIVALRDCPDIPALRKFVKGGGGLITGQTPWGWLQLNPGKTLRDMPLRDFLAEAGIAYSDGGADKVFKAPNDTDAKNVSAAYAMEKMDGEGRAHASTLLMNVLESAPDTHPLNKAIREKAEKAEVPVITEKTPLKSENAWGRLALRMRMLDREMGLPSPKIDPNAADFPGVVAENAPRIERTLALDLDAPQWVSTGLYAAPGENISITVPLALTTGAYRIQIGCHSDRNWHHDAWKRHPQIVTSATIKQPITTLSSPFGGLIYVVADRRYSKDPVNVTIKGGVMSPRFILGTTTNETWISECEKSGAPWAELQGKHLILSVPISEAKKVSDPKKLMELWDTIMDAYSELDGNPLPNRPERIVADRQISAGYMHSGYPIMTWMDDSVPLSLSYDRLTTQGTWGHWHELGHNRQRQEWTFEGTGEVTNNIFTIFMMERFAKKPLRDRIGAKAKDIEKYFADGSPFERWKSDPFLALCTYADLIEGFGWDSMKQYFRSYEQSSFGPKPKGDQEERDQFLVRYSKITGKNLSPFFLRWGIPTSDAAKQEVRLLPVWTPPYWP